MKIYIFLVENKCFEPVKSRIIGIFDNISNDIYKIYKQNTNIFIKYANLLN